MKEYEDDDGQYRMKLNTTGESQRAKRKRHQEFVHNFYRIEEATENLAALRARKAREAALLEQQEKSGLFSVV